jgi:hypothetical protein
MNMLMMIWVVFQPKLDILGMVIYATEFVLWCGVFACGGYFNLVPWVRTKLSEREQKKQEEERAQRGNGATEQMETENEGTSQDVELSRIGSSTSVFRTPSSVASSRISVRSIR